jgi:hypothetical protein
MIWMALILFTAIGEIPTVDTILKHIAMLFRGSDHKESSVFQYGITNCDTGTICRVAYTIQVPVTTFLKVAYSTR